MIGKVLKYRYEILEKIGEGNLFTVYKCEDKINNRTLAVKVLLLQYASNKMFAERLLVEAQAMIGIQHPGIVEVYDCGEEDGVYFVVVEYVRGVDLKERIKRSAPFTLSTAVDVGIAISDVLEYAHHRGFIHGDLRPGNIMVTTEGQIKLADFWVSNAVSSAQAIRTTALMRSVHYMSPEVAEGSPATAAADVYSLGIILFELLTGRVPFDGETPIAIAVKHSREPIPSVRALNPGVTKTLESIIARALQKSPDDRFHSAQAMMKELKSVRDSLHLEKPLVWSEVGEKKTPEPTPEEADLPSEPEKPESTWLTTVRNSLFIGVIVAVVALFIASYFASSTGSEVKIPNLLGKTVDEASTQLAANHITLQTKTEEFNEQYPEGTIYYMSPLAGRMIKSGKSIDVWISKGSKYVMTPSVVKLTQESAIDKLREAGLTTGEVSQQYSSTVPMNCIIKQSPTPGTKQERGQAVSLVLSLGMEPSEVPPAATTEQQDQSSTDEEQTTRSFNIQFTVPPGPKDQQVEIKVVDDNGDNTAYTDIKHPGDQVKQTIEGVGTKVIIRIYLDDKLVKEESK